MARAAGDALTEKDGAASMVAGDEDEPCFCMGGACDDRRRFMAANSRYQPFEPIVVYELASDQDDDRRCRGRDRVARRSKIVEAPYVIRSDRTDADDVRWLPRADELPRDGPHQSVFFFGYADDHGALRGQ